jgi:hypothetical protein
MLSCIPPLIILAGLASAATAQEFRTEIPPEITTPDTLETSIGTLRFFDGFPDAATTQKVYDNLDLIRGVEAFLNGMPAAAFVALRSGVRDFGEDNRTVIIFEQLVDSRSLFLTANADSIYAAANINLRDGPVVVESPPNTLGFVDDAWFRYVADIGNAGPDEGKGGKYLFLPPGYTGEVPEGYFVFKSRTYGNWFLTRGFQVDGDPKPGADGIKQHLRIYPLADAADPPETTFVNISGKAFNTIHHMDVSFFDELNEVIQEEPEDATDPETLGVLAGIGMQKGKPFAPDERMKKLLTDAAAIGSATARALTFRPRDGAARIYPDRHWQTAFIGGSSEFLDHEARLLDARTMFFFYATGVTPAMALRVPGAGSQYLAGFVDAEDQPLDGGKTYRLHLPSGIPANNFWSVTLYDNQTRSMLQTDQQFPTVGSNKPGVVANGDGSVDLYFSPTAPAGKKGNWVQTVPRKGWNALLRFYGPTEAFFDQSWRPGDFEVVN